MPQAGDGAGFGGLGGEREAEHGCGPYTALGRQLDNEWAGRNSAVRKSGSRDSSISAAY